MGILYLVRHGQANSGGLHTDNVAEGEMEATYDQLTELGHEQARVTGRALAERIGSGSAAAVAAAVASAPSFCPARWVDSSVRPGRSTPRWSQLAWIRSP